MSQDESNSSSKGNAQASEPAVQVNPVEGEPDLSGTGKRLTTLLFRDDTAAAMAVGNQTTEADTPPPPSANRMAYLRFVNHLDYQIRPLNSVTTSRNLRPYYPDLRDLTAQADEAIRLSWQLRTGNVFACTATSFLKFSILLQAPFTANNVGQDVIAANFGATLQPGRSFLDCIKSVRIRHKLGQVIEQVDNFAGMVMSQRVEEQWPSGRQDSVGSLFNWNQEEELKITVYDSSAPAPVPPAEPVVPKFTDFIVPLSLFTNLFTDYPTLPPDLLSGMILEIDFARPNRMFDLTNIGNSLNFTPADPKSPATLLSEWFTVYRQFMTLQMTSVLYLDEHQAASSIRQHQADLSASVGLSFRYERTDVTSTDPIIDDGQGFVNLGDDDERPAVWNKNRSDVTMHQMVVVAPPDDWSFDNQFENIASFILSDYYFRTVGYKMTRQWTLIWRFTLSGEERWPYHSRTVLATITSSLWNTRFGLPPLDDIAPIQESVGQADWSNRMANRQRYNMEKLPYKEGVQYMTMPVKTHDSLPVAGIAQSPERVTTVARSALERPYDDPTVIDPQGPEGRVYETHFNQVLLDLQKVNVVALVQLDSITLLL